MITTTCQRDILIDVDDTSRKKKQSLLLHALGPKAINIYETFSFMLNQGEMTTDPEFDEVLPNFEMHFLPRVNVTYEQHCFFT